MCVTWIAAMTYVSEVRLKNPDYDANLLLQNTYKLNDRIYRAFIISAAVLHGSICQLMRYCWHTEGFCDPYQRDETIEVYERCVMALPSLETDVLNSALAELKVIFGPDKGVQLQKFWDNDNNERGIVFAQAQDPEFKSYVQMFLQQAAEPTKNDIASRKRVVPEASCLKTAPIHNMRAENLFAHQSYAEQSTRAGHNRLRGLGLSKASSTFALRGKLRMNRKKRFLAMVKRSKAELSDWKDKHQEDDGFLNLFNEKFISVEKRHEIILQAISGRRCNKKKNTTGKRKRNALELQAQDASKLERKLKVNRVMLTKHENKVKDFLKLMKRRRFRTVVELETFFGQKNVVDGLEYSYAKKCNILRDQIQIRKKLDGIRKVGETAINNCNGTPEPLAKLMEFFALVCSREAAHGIPPPVQPQLMDQRTTKPGADTLATKLLQQQHEQAAALTNAFYSNNRVEEDGEFVA